METKSQNPHASRVRTASEEQLVEWSGLTPGSELRAAAVVELDRRKFWRSFLTHGISSWFALIVSVLALSVSAYVAFVK